MTTHLLRRAAAATAGLAAVLSTVAVAAPASAEVFTKSDPAGDVASDNGPRPEVRNGDIRTTRLEHARNVVTFRVEYRDLAREGSAIQQYVRIQTPATTYDYSIQATPANWQGELQFAEPRPCAGAEWRFDYGTNVFTMRVPRGCLDGPRWVKAGLATITYPTNSELYGVDGALQSSNPAGPDEIRLSPRLSRAGGAYTG